MQPGSWDALKILHRELGFGRLVSVVCALLWGQLRGAPFRDLAPADSPEEKLSRAQIGPGILLYQILLRKLPQSEAYVLAQEVISAGAIAFLRISIGPLKSEELAALDEAQRLQFVKERGKRFFNATMRWDTVEPTAVSFTVTSCRFPRLCQEAGSPELAPAFCEGDATFFGQVEPNVVLERPSTIAGGGQTCQFHLRWVGEGASEKMAKISEISEELAQGQSRDG